MLAVLALLLGSGTAISLAAAPTAPGPDAPEVVAFGGAPATGAPPSSPGAPARPSAPEPETGATGPETAPEPSAGPDPGTEPAPGSPPDPPPEAEDRVDEITAMEDEVTALTNEERREAGCGEVTTDERLRTAARAHSEDMAAHDYFDHTGRDGRSPFDRMRDAGYPDPAGENIALGYRTPADVVAGWMDSDGHRRNILTCSHRAIGVGLAYDGAGRPYWTQDFGR